MLHALFALILIPAGLNALGFRPPYGPCGHLDGALLSLSFISVVLRVMMALHLSMSLSACISIEGGVVLRIRLNTPLARVGRPGCSQASA